MLLVDVINVTPSGWEIIDFRGSDGFAAISKGNYIFEFERGMWRCTLNKVQFTATTPSELITSLTYHLHNMLRELNNE